MDTLFSFPGFKSGVPGSKGGYFWNPVQFSPSWTRLSSDER